MSHVSSCSGGFESSDNLLPTSGIPIWHHKSPFIIYFIVCLFCFDFMVSHKFLECVSLGFGSFKYNLTSRTFLDYIYFDLGEKSLLFFFKILEERLTKLGLAGVSRRKQ